jgi:hypothetical protein
VQPTAVQPTERVTEIEFTENGQRNLNPLAGRGVAIADFNGDGSLDAFAVNEDGPEGQGYRVYFGDGHGRFTDSGQGLANPIDWGGKPAIDDINGDGQLEVITGRTVWLHDGSGNFSADTDRFTDPDRAGIGQTELADLNGDGYLDLFGTVFGDKGAEGRVYLNDGQGHFRDTGQRLGQGSQAAVTLGDLNDDGHTDAVITGWRENSSDPSPNRVWINDGKGNFAETGQVLDEDMRHVHGLALGDMDKDGDPDLILGMQQAPFARIYHNDGQGRFTAAQTLGTCGVEQIELDDLDGDGSLDVFLACNGPNEVWINDGQGCFRDSGLRLGSEWSWDVALGDLNGDGKLDAFVVNLAFDLLQAEPWYIARGRPAEIWLNTTQSSGQ